MKIIAILASAEPMESMRVILCYHELFAFNFLVPVFEMVANDVDHLMVVTFDAVALASTSPSDGWPMGGF